MFSSWKYPQGARLPNGIITILLKKYWPGMFAPDQVNHPERKILATCWDHYEAAFHPAHETAAKAVISNFWKFYRVLEEHKATADEFVLRATRKQTRQIQYEVHWVAISRYYHDAHGEKVTKEEDKENNLNLTREQYMLVPPDWCYGKANGWAGLVDLWVGEDAEFAAKSNINRANRGSDGTHGQGNRNHWHHKKLQEEKLKRPLSDIESWRLARVRPNRKAGESEYYGHTGENLESYKEEFKKWNPDKPDPMSMDADERAVVSIGPKSHGRQPVLDSVITPSISYRRIRATNPRWSPRPCLSTSTAQSILAQRHSASLHGVRTSAALRLEPESCSSHGAQQSHDAAYVCVYGNRADPYNGTTTTTSWTTTSAAYV